LNGVSSITGFVGNRVEEAGIGVSLIPGAQEIGLPIIETGKKISLLGDIPDFAGDLLLGKTDDALKKVGFIGLGLILGQGTDIIPTSKFGKQAIDSYLGRGTGAIKDGYFDNRVRIVEESDELNLTIERKK